MTNNLTLAVGAKEKRARIVKAFCGLLLTCRHNYDTSDTPAAQAVMERRQEEYIDALWEFPIQVIEEAKRICKKSESGWFPSSGEWVEAAREIMARNHREATNAAQAAVTKSYRDERVQALSDPDVQARWQEFCAQVKAKLRSMR